MQTCFRNFAAAAPTLAATATHRGGAAAPGSVRREEAGSRRTLPRSRQSLQQLLVGGEGATANEVKVIFIVFILKNRKSKKRCQNMFFPFKSRARPPQPRQPERRPRGGEAAPPQQEQAAAAQEAAAEAAAIAAAPLRASSDCQDERC